jgi:hypothetical protein
MEAVTGKHLVGSPLILVFGVVGGFLGTVYMDVNKHTTYDDGLMRGADCVAVFNKPHPSPDEKAACTPVLERVERYLASE